MPNPHLMDGNPPLGQNGWPRSRTGALDLDATTTFLQVQAAWLRRGLQRADDPRAVSLVLTRHDESHGSWLRLIAVIGACLPEATVALGQLYMFHGRIAGVLEQPEALPESRWVAGRVRDRLDRLLWQLTDQAVEELRTAAVR